MEIKCEYCDNLIQDTVNVCPYCGAPNNNMSRAANKIPKTIAELKAFCAEHRIDTARMHFHIGENYKAPKAFGIYKDGENYIVYKNKADGTRAVRYKGKDEAYAVNEIYQKLKAEVLEVRERAAASGARPGSNGSSRANAYKNPNNPFNAGSSTRSFMNTKKKKKIGCLGWILIIFFGIPAALALLGSLLEALGLVKPEPNKGYYDYNGSTYYYNDDHWYEYDGSDWYSTTVDDDLSDNFDDYYYDSYSGEVFDEDAYYSYGNNWDDDWDDDDWSWGSSSSSSYDDDDDWSWDWGSDDDDDWGSSWDSDSDWDSWDSGSDWDSDW